MRYLKDIIIGWVETPDTSSNKRDKRKKMRYQVQCGLIPDWIPHMPTKIEMDAFRIEIGEKRMSEKVVVTFDFKDLKTGANVDICPHCKVQPHSSHWEGDLLDYPRRNWEGNLLDYDDFGLTCCQECMDKHPAWQRAWDGLPS